MRKRRRRTQVEQETLRAIQFRNLDEAREVLKNIGAADQSSRILNDAGEEPQGLLSVICEDQLPEELFYKLFGLEKGVLVEVERISYEGFGPPAEEEEYMGFISRKMAYVLTGCRIPIEIADCPLGALDIHHLEAQVLDGEHPLDRNDLAYRLKLQPNWDFDDLFVLLTQGITTADEIDRLIHEGLS
jgi:hypothetical protein